MRGHSIGTLAVTVTGDSQPVTFDKLLRKRVSERTACNTHLPGQSSFVSERDT